MPVQHSTRKGIAGPELVSAQIKKPHKLPAEYAVSYGATCAALSVLAISQEWTGNAK